MNLKYEEKFTSELINYLIPNSTYIQNNFIFYKKNNEYIKECYVQCKDKNSCSYYKPYSKINKDDNIDLVWFNEDGSKKSLKESLNLWRNENIKFFDNRIYPSLIPQYQKLIE